jgi:hypothetical protein
MLYLATASTRPVRDAMRAGYLGQMVTPLSGNRLEPGVPFGLDNGCFSSNGWNETRWRRTLERYADVPSCLFAVVPDVVANAAATDELWERWAPVVRDHGYRPAYVLQDGCGQPPADAPVLFNGGSTAFKLGEEARRLVHEAKARGIWCHMGRVNSLRRLRVAAADGYDSVDGTFLAYGPDQNLPRLLAYLRLADQPRLFGAPLPLRRVAAPNSERGMGL